MKIHPTFSHDISTLRKGFNGKVGRVRLLLLLSPTCGTCLRGASKVQREVLDRMPSSDLDVFVVWLPMLQWDDESQVPQAMAAIPDVRATHFWDGQRELSKAYSHILRLQYDLHTWDRALIFRWLLHMQLRVQGRPLLQPAWDVYLIFNRQVQWKDEPPTPDFWMHQLRVSETHRLNGERLAAAVHKQLQRG